MAWRIEPTERKAIVVVSDYRKVTASGEEIYLSQEMGYRSGYVEVDDDPTAEARKADKAKKPLYVSDFGIRNWSYDDGCWSKTVGADQLPQEEQRLLEQAGRIEDAGWRQTESSDTAHFHGKLNILNLD